jgi:hypothetical protein
LDAGDLSAACHSLQSLFVDAQKGCGFVAIKQALELS